MLLLLAGIFSLVSMTSCKDDKDEDDPKNPVASFQYAIDQDDFLKVHLPIFRRMPLPMNGISVIRLQGQTTLQHSRIRCMNSLQPEPIQLY